MLYQSLQLPRWHGEADFAFLEIIHDRGEVENCKRPCSSQSQLFIPSMVASQPFTFFPRWSRASLPVIVMLCRTLILSLKF